MEAGECPIKLTCTMPKLETNSALDEALSTVNQAYPRTSQYHTHHPEFLKQGATFSSLGLAPAIQRPGCFPGSLPGARSGPGDLRNLATAELTSSPFRNCRGGTTAIPKDSPSIPGKGETERPKILIGGIRQDL